ncbi:hypothetical protein GF325_00140, partial [Candidatus Bathyarchaeota archaeon]|nr:hypothetical protein [Candidatus Bathyarchaeota archaeon]
MIAHKPDGVMTIIGYPGVRCWQRRGAKPGEQYSLVPSHEGMEELAKAPMANESEGMINPVTSNWRKVAGT